MPTNCKLILGYYRQQLYFTTRLSFFPCSSIRVIQFNHLLAWKPADPEGETRLTIIMKRFQGKESIFYFSLLNIFFIFFLTAAISRTSSLLLVARSSNDETHGYNGSPYCLWSTFRNFLDDRSITMQDSIAAGHKIDSVMSTMSWLSSFQASATLMTK